MAAKDNEANDSSQFFLLRSGFFFVSILRTVDPRFCADNPSIVNVAQLGVDPRKIHGLRKTIHGSSGSTVLRIT